MLSRRVTIALGILLAIVLLVALGPARLAGGFITAIAPVPFYVALALWLDRHEPEPRHLLVQAFVWGMLVASLVALVMNAAAVAYVQYTLGLSALLGNRIGTVAASPVFEEIAKGGALFLLFHRERREFDSIVDGAIYAAMIGLGFAVTENIIYYGNAIGHSRLLAVFALRGLASPFAHPLFTAMTGMGFGYAREASNKRSAVARILAGLFAAITLHALWNSAGAAHMFTEAYAMIMVPTFIGVVLLLQASLKRERRIVRRNVRALLSHEELTDRELELVCVHGGLRGWVTRNFASAGRRARAHDLHRVRRAAVDLGFCCWHDERGKALSAGATDATAVARMSFLDALRAWRGREGSDEPGRGGLDA